MDRLPPELRGRCTSDAKTADAGIANGKVEATTNARSQVWEEWVAYCESIGVPPYLDGCDFQRVAHVATMFADRLQKGKQGKTAGTGQVCTGLGGVGTTIAMDTGRQPLH